MLGGLGKLAAEGLAHRTEKATEEAGEDPITLHRGALPGLEGLGRLDGSV